MSTTWLEILGVATVQAAAAALQRRDLRHGPRCSRWDRLAMVDVTLAAGVASLLAVAATLAVCSDSPRSALLIQIAVCLGGALTYLQVTFWPAPLFARPGAAVRSDACAGRLTRAVCALAGALGILLAAVLVRIAWAPP